MTVDKSDEVPQVASQRAVKKAFNAAVQELINVLQRKGNRARLQEKCERYEALSGLSRSEADKKISDEADRRLGLKH